MHSPPYQLIPAQQAQLEATVRELFAGHDVHVNTRRKTAITNPTTGHPLELDIWVANKDISFEFQDSYHYMTTWYSQVSLHSIQARDNSKRQVVRNRGSTLVEVPCWWDGLKESLLATILFHRPDLACTLHCQYSHPSHIPTQLPHSPSEHLSPANYTHHNSSVNLHPPQNPIPLHQSPHHTFQDPTHLHYSALKHHSPQGPSIHYSQDLILLNPPHGFLLSYGFVPDVGTLMLASFPPLSVQFGKIISRDNYWWMGEKYDGVLCCWNPYERVLYSRAGIELVMPKSFNNQIHPSQYPFLCGELWCGRGAFSETQQLVNARMQSFNWSTLRLLTFDDPSPEIKYPRSRPFEERYATILCAIHPYHPFLIVVGRAKCNTPLHLDTHVMAILKDEGEGVILRRPGSLYTPGRSDNLVKLKASRADREGLVVSVESNSVHLQLTTGIIFSIPIQHTHDHAHVHRQLCKGDIVTVAFDCYDHHGMPVDASILKIRQDLTWAQVLHSSDQTNPHFLDNSSQKVFGTTSKSVNSWTSEKGSTLQKFFEKYAQSQGSDPLVSEFWYTVSRPDFVKNVPGASAVLSYFEGSLTKALISLFPSVKFDESKFIIVPRKFWKELQNRKAVFDKFARDNKFDPLVPDNWYQVSYDMLISTKGISSILQYYYNNNIKKALMHIYPNIGLDQTNFPERNNWTKFENRRSFFINFAKAKGFDPFVFENWKQVAPSTMKNTAQLLQYYNGSLISALHHLLFDKSKIP